MFKLWFTLRPYSKTTIPHLSLRGNRYKFMDFIYTMQNSIFYTINNILIGKREAGKKAKLQIFKSLCRPTIMYWAESWTILYKHASPITLADV